jgi:type IV pilus assembly protein PilM
MLFSKPSKAVGIDIGTHSVKTAQMSRRSGRLALEKTGYAVIDPEVMSTAPVEAQGAAVREALRFMPLAQCTIVGALPGQAVVIRYPRLQDMAVSQISAAVEAEASQSIPYELNEVFLDWAVLDHIAEGDRQLLKVLLVAAKHEIIEMRVQVAEAAETQYHVLGVDSLALADAAEACDFLRVGETVALVNLGATNTNIHFIKDGRSSFVRDVTWGGREMLQAITKNRRCDSSTAERMLINSEHEHEEAQEPSAPQSGNQLDALGDVGSSILDPLEDELDAGPARPAIGSGMADTAKSLESILSVPLGRLVNEIRRSFDYYEQQLYEHSVDRIILSGGVAQLPVVRDTLADELGHDHVEVADPSKSALTMADRASIADLLNRPAQFMVAVGLAARGAAEL